jgi:hypothetical protein
MNKATVLGKILWGIAIVLLGLASIFNLLGGAGTSCVALAAENYESMAGIVPFKWLYVVFVVLTIAAAVLGIRATIAMVRRKAWSFRAAIIALLLALGLAALQIIASRLLRGKSQPNDMRFYITLITLLFFLVLRIPAIWKQLGLQQAGGSGEGGTAAGLAAIVMGVATLTVQYWAGPTHTFAGVNFADVWHTQLAVLGWGLLVGGAAALLVTELLRAARSQRLSAGLQSPG